MSKKKKDRALLHELLKIAARVEGLEQNLHALREVVEDQQRTEREKEPLGDMPDEMLYETTAPTYETSDLVYMSGMSKGTATNEAFGFPADPKEGDFYRHEGTNTNWVLQGDVWRRTGKMVEKISDAIKKAKITDAPSEDWNVLLDSMRWSYASDLAAIKAWVRFNRNEGTVNGVSLRDFLAGIRHRPKEERKLNDMLTTPITDPVRTGDYPDGSFADDNDEEFDPGPATVEKMRRQYGVDDSAYVPEEEINIASRPLGETPKEFLLRTLGTEEVPFPGTSPEDGKR